LTEDVAVTFTFEGDTFEFEDQRNWTDGSFKSQSYPPRRGGLFHADAEQHLFQKVTITATAPSRRRCDRRGHHAHPGRVNRRPTATLGSA
jgi:hypothetical protein